MPTPLEALPAYPDAAPAHHRLAESMGQPSRQSTRRSRGGVMLLTLLLLGASVVWVPAFHVSRRADGAIPDSGASSPPAREWVFLPTALGAGVPYRIMDEGESGKVLERGSTRWEIDWWILAFTWVVIAGVGGMMSMLLTDPQESHQPSDQA